ncbi:MAG: GNAT family N-acetyltransferase [Pirellulales bacterium]|nr:GNAT family N-acetyltransferase [Pirellulales bacterium]
MVENLASEQQVICEVAHGSPEYWATVGLRNLILRQPLGLEFTEEEREADKKFHHFASYLGGRLAGCLVLCPREGGDVQMRQVAVVAELQGQGVGTALVEYSEAWARQAGYRRMILHARDTAVAFYEKLGYSKVGEQFVEISIPHWEMEKRLIYIFFCPTSRAKCSKERS